jgi:two-component system phosphate regulon sensor histidine kinase PhoR
MKSRSLVWQLYPSYLFIALLVLIGLGWYFSVALRSFHYEQTAEDLASRALLVEEQLPGHLGRENQINLLQLIQRLGDHSDTRITIILKNGTVLADSHENARNMENHGKRPEVVSALNGKTGEAIRFSQTLGQTLMYVAVPLVQNSQLIGSVRTARPLSDIDEALRGIYRRLFGGGFFIILLALPISWFLARRISRPLKEMTLAAQHFSQGHFTVPLVEKGSEETSRLARALNVMAGDLSTRISREEEQRRQPDGIRGLLWPRRGRRR